MAIYAIGDPHLSFDERIEKPMDVFGKEWENHADRLKENWERAVTEDDLVIVCGDISWGLREEEAMADILWLDALPGRKVVIKGNHDLWWTSVSRLNAISERMTFLQNTVFTWGDVGICGTRGWICPGTEGFAAHDEKIYRRELLRLEMSLQEAKKAGCGTLIAALHYPPTNNKLQPSGFTELLAAYGVRTCVYGHLHGPDAYHSGFKGTLNGVTYKLVSLDYVGAVPQLICGTPAGEAGSERGE